MMLEDIGPVTILLHYAQNTTNSAYVAVSLVWCDYSTCLDSDRTVVQILVQSSVYGRYTK